MIAMLLSVMMSALATIGAGQTYFGVNHPLPVTIEGADSLLWLTAKGEVKQDTPISTGEVDLAELFDGLWTTQEVTYAQPARDGEPVGPALVLQPMLSVQTATLAAAEEVHWTGRPTPVISGLRVYPERLVKLVTSMGDITLRMRPDEAPNTVFSFLSLAEGGYYTDIIFHRIKDQFMIQSGDPTGTGGGGPGYFIDLEPSALPHDFGVIGMARTGKDPNSNGSQFFICLSREKTQHLDGLYTTFGEMYDGADVIRAIGAVETDDRFRPADPPMLERVELLPAPARELWTGEDDAAQPMTDEQHPAELTDR